MKRGFTGEHIPLFDKMLLHDQPGQGEGPPSPCETQHTPIIIETSPQLQNISNTYRKIRIRTRRIGIRIPLSNAPSSSVADEAIIKEMHDGLARPKRLSNLLHDLPLPGGYTPVSDESSKKLNELTELCTKLYAKVTSLEDELTSTKAVYNKAFITLTKRVKKLEKQLKHKKRKVVINSSEDEEPILDVEDSPKQGRMIAEINKDKNINLVKSSEKEEAHASAEH
ncbi:hypothetical protein Tco_0850402 [Tanacetum coccineum]